MSEQMKEPESSRPGEIPSPEPLCCVPKMEIPKYLVDQLKNRMVNVWAHDERGHCIQGIFVDYDHMFIRVRSNEGKDLFVSWQSGPIVQKI